MVILHQNFWMVIMLNWSINHTFRKWQFDMKYVKQKIYTSTEKKRTQLRLSVELVCIFTTKSQPKSKIHFGFRCCSWFFAKLSPCFFFKKSACVRQCMHVCIYFNRGLTSVEKKTLHIKSLHIVNSEPRNVCISYVVRLAKNEHCIYLIHRVYGTLAYTHVSWEKIDSKT